MPNHSGLESNWEKHWNAFFEGSLKLGPGGPGGAVCVLKEGEELYANGFGKASIANDIAFTPETPCGAIARRS